MRRHWPWLAVGALTLLGLALRLLQYDQSLFGDEMSTLWIVHDRSLGDVLDLVRGDAEISPPLSFALSWLAAKLGSDPNLIRLPSLIAGTASIPLVFELGRRTVGTAAGLVGAAVFTLSPFMTYFSGNGRAYALLTLFLACSTLFLLIALERGGLGWWAGYAAASALAMYSHYTGAFVLAGQLLWLAWAHRDAWLPALLANAAAALAFLPWLPGLLDDLDSPTTPILEALQGDGFDAKRIAFQEWGFGHPGVETSSAPGTWVMVLVAAVLAAALVLSLLALNRRGAPPGARRLGPLPEGLVLVLVLALATPVGEALLSLIGTDLLGSRNMAASWYGFALAAGALVTIPGGAVAAILAAALLAGYAGASVAMLRDEGRFFDTEGPAASIDRQVRAGDVIVDVNAALSSPTPLTPLDVYSDAEAPVFRPGFPQGEPPFLGYSEIEDPQRVVRRAFARARGHRVLLLAPELLEVDPNRGARRPLYSQRRLVLPPGARVRWVETFPSFRPSRLYAIDVRSPQR